LDKRFQEIFLKFVIVKHGGAFCRDERDFYGTSSKILVSAKCPELRNLPVVKNDYTIE
jgi:hypothetical protein